MNSTNLIPMARQLRNARRARLIRWGVTSAAIIALLAGADGLLRLNVARSASIDATQCARLNNEIAEKTKAANQLRGEIQMIDRQVQASRVVTEHPDYSVLLSLLSQTAGTQVTLHQCAVDRPQHGEEIARNVPPTLRVSGFGASQSAVTSFVLRLEATGVFDQVTLLRSNEQNDVGGATTSFQLECLFEAGSKETP
jgi:hypothetical protein